MIYRWEIAPEWDQEHHIEIAIAQLIDDGSFNLLVGEDGSVSVSSELLSSERADARDVIRTEHGDTLSV